MEQAIQHFERFDPAKDSGRLIDSEHRARYWWASRAVPGKDVLDAGCGVGYGMEILSSAGARKVAGVDIDPTAVKEAQARLREAADDVVEGDLCELPFSDASFDVLICFEVIEHLKDGDRALSEFSRVLRQDGLLIVSSPNPDVYLGGNEHHFHEYRPAELVAAVGEHFSHAASYRQHPFLASMIEPADAEPGDLTGERGSPEVRRTGASEEDRATYGIVVAGNAELPSLDGIVSLGEAFEVSWWSAQVENRVRDAARAAEQEASALRRLQETSTALLDANRELAQIPVLEHRIAALQEAHNEVLNSRSWRLTAPLRGRRMFGLRRR